MLLSLAIRRQQGYAVGYVARGGPEGEAPKWRAAGNFAAMRRIPSALDLLLPKSRPEPATHRGTVSQRLTSDLWDMPTAAPWRTSTSEWAPYYTRTVPNERESSDRKGRRGPAATKALHVAGRDGRSAAPWPSTWPTTEGDSARCPSWLCSVFCWRRRPVLSLLKTPTTT